MRISKIKHKRARVIFPLFAFALLLNFKIGFAQGPPINTDTPIMLGLEGGGIRTFAKFVRRTTLLQGGKEIPDNMEQQVTVRITPVIIPYNLFSDKIQVGIIAPFVDIDLESTAQKLSNAGLGDVRFFAKYLLYQRDRRGETLRVATKAGVKFPIGEASKTPALGSGSTDYFFSTVAGWVKNRTGIYLEGIYNLNTSHNQVDFGNSFSYNFTFGYRLLPVVYETYPSPQLNGFLEINGSTMAKSKISSVAITNSGGTTIFLSPGLQYVGGRRWLVEASLQIPVVNQPNGTQLAIDWTLSIGTRILLF